MRVTPVPNGFCVTSPAAGDSSDRAPCDFQGHTVRLGKLPPGITYGSKPRILCCVSPAHQSSSKGHPNPLIFLREVCYDHRLLLSKGYTGLLAKVGQTHFVTSHSALRRSPAQLMCVGAGPIYLALLASQALCLQVKVFKSWPNG